MTVAEKNRRERDLAYGGICPVCDEEFSDGYTQLLEYEEESIEGCRLCVIDPPNDVLLHLPEDQE